MVSRETQWLKVFAHVVVASTLCAPPPLCAGRGRVEPLTKFSKRGGLTGPQLLERGCWERGGDFFQGEGVKFLHKNKI